mgnify:CR=1 FL=1|jgi:hypothetical protein
MANCLKEIKVKIDIDINNDLVDTIMAARLHQDYQYLVQDINRLNSMPKLEDFQQEDLEDHVKYKDCLELMLEYYVGFDWKTKLTKETEL